MRNRSAGLTFSSSPASYLRSSSAAAPFSLLDVSVLREAGWQSKITLREGIESTVAWYRANAGAARK